MQSGPPPPHLAELTEQQKQKLNAARRYCQEQSVRHVMEQQELQTKQFMQGTLNTFNKMGVSALY